MSKKYTWEYTGEETELTEEGEAITKTVTHEVELVCSNLTGRAIVKIDGDRFDISTRPLGLRGSNQMFRLGEEAAMLDFPKKGAPRILVGGKEIAKK